MEDKKTQASEQVTPSQGVNPETEPNTEHGIPPEMHDAEPKGSPTSDRHSGEVSATKP